MRHNRSGRKLNRTAAHRKMLYRNLVTALFEHERIQTTVIKAKEARILAEKLITFAKRGDLHARRMAARKVNDPAVLQSQLDSAKAQGQWVLVDYYADWCVSCKIMEKQVFGKPEVMDALKDVRLLRLDVTADNAASRELLGRYKVPGPPSFVWIGPDGEERRAQRITGEVDAAAFLQRWMQTRDAR